jgi:small-conductance mechanosensitive channel
LADSLASARGSGHARRRPLAGSPWPAVVEPVFTGLRPNAVNHFITLLVALTYYGILLLATMFALAALGVPTSLIFAVAGVAVVILAIALQQSLGNLAATLVFLLFKPFEIGDVVETDGVFGSVNEFQMLSTVVLSPDNKTQILPNAKRVMRVTGVWHGGSFSAVVQVGHCA